MTTNLPKLKVFVYTRKSQERADRQVLSIQGQLDEAKKYFAAHPEYQPIYLPPEERTASKPGRPIFDDMMSRIAAGESKHIWSWECKRIARNPKDGGNVLQALRDTSLLSILTPYRNYTQKDQFELSMLFAMSTKESDDNSDGVKRGYRAKYERGEYCGQAPTGYVNGLLGVYRNILPDPMRAHLVLKTFEEAATGKYTLNTLHKYARDELGLTSRTGKPIAKQTLQGILRSRVYTGVYWHSGEWRRGTYPPIVIADLFDKVQIAMGWTRKSKRNSLHDLLFTYKGPFLCPTCGHNVTAYTKTKTLSNGQEVSYTYYVCTRKSKKVMCRQPQISEEELEQEVINQLSALKLNKDEASECLTLLKQFHREFIEQRNNFLTVWEKDLQDAKEKSKRLIEMRVNNEISQSVFNEHLARYEETIVRTEKQIESYSHNAEQWLELAESIFSSAVNISEIFKHAEPEDKKKILLEVGSNWYLDNKKAAFTPRKPYDVLVKRGAYPNWRG